jgi:hypothetical protein
MTLPLPAVITSRGMMTAPDADVPAFVDEDCAEVDDAAELLELVVPDAAPAAALAEAALLAEPETPLP